MKAEKILFNGEQFFICENLKALIQDSMESCAPGKCIVKSVTITDSEVEIVIRRRLEHYYEVGEGFINLGDTIIISGVLNRESETKIAIGPHPYAEYVNYHNHISDIVEGYNKIMKRKNKLLDMRVKSTPDEVSYTLKFKN